MTKKEYIEKYGGEAYQRCLGQQKQYKEQHREQIKQYNQQYKEQHKEEIKEQNKQYYQQHINEKKEWKRKNECMFAYCIPEQIEQIENYEFAKKVNFDGWDIHHRLETHNSDGEKRLVNLSRAELIALDMYYNRPASELVFLAKSEHMKLHRMKTV